MVEHLPPEYEEKYVAYLDVLGFRKKIEEMEKNSEEGMGIFQIVRDIFDQVEIELRATNNFAALNGDGAQFASFSDSMALSTAATSAGLMSIITRISGMCMGFMRKGIFIRGAIAKGLLFHRKNQLFGGGLVRAVILEENLARYPRVVFSKQVADDVTNLPNPLLHGWRNDICKQDKDGVMMLAAFYPYYATSSEASGLVFAEDHIRDVASHISNELKKFDIDDERHAKMFWLKEQINEAIDHWQLREQLGNVQKI